MQYTGGVTFSPEDILYGEVSMGDDGRYIELLYLDRDDGLRLYQGYISRISNLMNELLIMLRNEERFYVVPVTQRLCTGVAFKRNDIMHILSTRITGDSATYAWRLDMKMGKTHKITLHFDCYMVYGYTIRPASMTNQPVLKKVFPELQDDDWSREVAE